MFKIYYKEKLIYVGFGKEMFIFIDAWTNAGMFRICVENNPPLQEDYIPIVDIRIRSNEKS